MPALFVTGGTAFVVIVRSSVAGSAVTNGFISGTLLVGTVLLSTSGGVVVVVSIVVTRTRLVLSVLFVWLIEAILTLVPLTRHRLSSSFDASSFPAEQSVNSVSHLRPGGIGAGDNPGLPRPA